MKGNLVAKHMNRVNRPSIHKNGNKASQEPLEESEVFCHLCGSMDLDEISLQQICKQCKKESEDD